MDAFQDAAVAAAVAAWRVEQVHEVGKVPATPQMPYLVMSVSSGSVENYLLSADHGSRSYRIVAQAVGKTASEVAFAVEKVDEAYLDKSLTVAGFDCSPCRPEVSSPVIRDPDGGSLLSATVTYTFTAYPTE